MKRLIYLLPLLLALATGCFKDDSQPAPEPAGTYAGEFRHISKHPDNSLDTIKANVTVVIEPGIGYHVLGDTTTVHAGSKGHYAINSTSMIFKDETYPKTGTPTKSHLSGEYVYVYNGTIFQIAKSSGDTVAYQYDLTKTN